MAVQLPDELIVEILSILPAKSLLRCRSVCKSWLSLITSTQFKLMHLHNFNQLNPRYFVRRLDLFANQEWFCVHFDDEAFSVDPCTQIEFPFDRSRVNPCFRIIGCCNGVVCLSDDEDAFYSFSLETIILWNPSIKRKLTLTLPMPCSIESFVVLGFGYDKMSDDYKVVSLSYDEYSRPQVEVYTVKSGIWREVMFPDNLCCFYTNPSWSQIFYNGYLHWIAYVPFEVSNFSIMTFDITTELFGEIQLPEFLPKESESLMVSVVGESLAVIYSSNLNWDGMVAGSTYMVWVMKEYKDPTSWTLLYGMHYTDMDLGKPLLLRNNEDMIVELENRDTIMINHNEGNYVYVFGDCVEEDFDCRAYVDRYQESLALLDVGDSVPNEEAMKALMMIEKQGMINLPNFSQMLFHGSLHLIASDPTPWDSHNSIMTFDISTEIFGEIQLPEILAKEFANTIVVSAVGESLAVIYSSNLSEFWLDSSGSTHMVWVMKEYKNPTSWMMIYNMHYPDINAGYPLLLRNNGDMILELNNGDMTIHNENVGYYVYVSGCREDYFNSMTHVDKYQESLALLDVGDIVTQEEAVMKVEKQEKLVKLCKNNHK